VLETLDTLIEERGEETIIWASMIKQTIKRQRPGFIERDYGFRSFSDVLEEAQSGACFVWRRTKNRAATLSAESTKRRSFESIG